MKLLTRYVLSEILQAFLLGSLAITFLLLLFGIGKEAIDRGLGFEPVLRLIPYILPKALLFAIPATLLLAVTIVLGRISAAGEIVALKSLGISPSAVLLPVLGISVVLSLVTFWLNDIAFSWGDQGVKQIAVDAFEEIAYSVLRSQRSFSSPQFSVNVKRVDGRKLIQPIFTFAATTNSPAIALRAQAAELRSKPGSGVLTVVCTNGTVDVEGTSIDFTDTFEREIPLVARKEDPHDGESPSKMPLSALPKRAIKQQARIELLEQVAAARTAYALAAGRWDYPTSPQALFDADQARDAKFELYRIRTEPPRRWANGFSCLCFAMVGAPLAIWRRYSEGLASFFLCFLPILVVYYPMMMYGVDRAKAGALPPMIVWLANGVFIVIGLALVRHVYRH